MLGEKKIKQNKGEYIKGGESNEEYMCTYFCAILYRVIRDGLSLK